jgi:hypothetical protein
MLMCWGGLWLMRQLGGWGRKAVPAWWCGLVVIALLGGTLTGCESAAREVAKLHGVKVDPFPGQCAPESFQAGHCVVVRQGSVK